MNKYSLTDIQFDCLKACYTFKGIPISMDCYEFIKMLIEKGKSEALIWWEDADGTRDHGLATIEEICMLDGGLLWGYFPDQDDELKKVEKEPCRYPFWHIFENKLMFHTYYNECTLCGYSPELDGSKPKYKKCHEEYIEYKIKYKNQ